MKHNSYLTLKAALVATSIITSALSTSAQAELIEYKYNGIDLVYSTVSNVSWLKDADLLCTMTKRDGIDNVVNKIINANGGKLQDANNTIGLQKVHFGEKVTTDNCQMPFWYGAMAFIKYLNAIQYGGLTTWQLPTVNAIDNSGGYTEYNAADKNVAVGFNGPFNGTISGNEFPELFYKELGAIPQHDINGNPNTSIGIHKSPNALKIFNNLKWGYTFPSTSNYRSMDGYTYYALYWTQSSIGEYEAYNFNQFYGKQGYAEKYKHVGSPGVAWPIIAGKPKNFYKLVSPRPVQVKAAFYGVEGKPTWEINGRKIVDIITRDTTNGTIWIPPNMNNYFGGDPLPNQQKLVAVTIQWGSITLNLRQKEGKALTFPGVEGEDFWLVP